MTEKLYYNDSHLYCFSASVLSCEKTGDHFDVILDRTAFFPEGGGQKADKGLIAGIEVLDVRLSDDVHHILAFPVDAGDTVECAVDAEVRHRRMQNHSGEHIISGLIHRTCGYDNVGFHMGEGFMTIDFNGELSRTQLREIELEANRAVAANIPIITSFPDAETAATITYRSKLDITENLRLVEIPGIDICACCAPHVSNTGEIGLIKILDSERHRGGTRITAVCGLDALAACNVMQDNVIGVSERLSAKKAELVPAVERVLGDVERLKQKNAQLGMEYARLFAASVENNDLNNCLFFDFLDDISARELVNMLMPHSNGIVAVFLGNDEVGYRYIIGSDRIDLKAESRHLNTMIDGRGGGSKTMITGRTDADRDSIYKAVMAYKP